MRMASAAPLNGVGGKSQDWGSPWGPNLEVPPKKNSHRLTSPETAGLLSC